MASLKKSYFLPPSWNIRPGEVKLGSVIANPKLPQRVLSTESLPMNIDTTIPPAFEESPFSGTSKKDGKWSVGLFATFMHFISLGGQASFSSDSIIQVDYEVEVMETRRFTPSLAYITKSVADTAVNTYLKTGGLGAKAFMITGIKTATNITITTIEKKTRQTVAKVGVDVPVVQTTVGPKLSYDSTKYEKHTCKIAGPIVFAFEVEKLRISLTGKVIHGEFVRGATLGEAEQATEYVVEKAGKGLDEDEVEDFGVQTHLGTDDESGESCQIFMP